MILLLLYYPLFLFPIAAAHEYPGRCTEPPTNRTSIHEVCDNYDKTISNSTNNEWYLYPVDYESHHEKGYPTDTFFRIGGIDWRCIDLVVRCANRTRLQLTLRCQNVIVVYYVDLVQSYQDNSRCCQIQLKMRPDMSKKCNFEQVGYEIWGHASRLLFVQMCNNMLHQERYVERYWLFVSRDQNASEVERALQMLLKHYRFLRLNASSAAPIQKDTACDCAIFDRYFEKRMHCNTPMFDQSLGAKSMESVHRKKLHLNDTKNVVIAVPKFVVHIVQGVVVLAGLLFAVYIMRRHEEYEL
uniref:Uncharacterized protein n=1 Tax=Anopheles melas TaxID=34690 RepID=A0A182TS94_9DIPT